MDCILYTTSDPCEGGFDAFAAAASPGPSSWSVGRKLSSRPATALGSASSLAGEALEIFSVLPFEPVSLGQLDALSTLIGTREAGSGASNLLVKTLTTSNLSGEREPGRGSFATNAVLGASLSLGAPPVPTVHATSGWSLPLLREGLATGRLFLFAPGDSEFLRAGAFAGGGGRHPPAVPAAANAAVADSGRGSPLPSQRLSQAQATTQTQHMLSAGVASPRPYSAELDATFNNNNILGGSFAGSFASPEPSPPHAARAVVGSAEASTSSAAVQKAPTTQQQQQPQQSHAHTNATAVDNGGLQLGASLGSAGLVPVTPSPVFAGKDRSSAASPGGVFFAAAAAASFRSSIAATASASPLPLLERHTTAAFNDVAPATGTAAVSVDCPAARAVAPSVSARGVPCSGAQTVVGASSQPQSAVPAAASFSEVSRGLGSTTNLASSGRFGTAHATQQHQQQPHVSPPGVSADRLSKNDSFASLAGFALPVYDVMPVSAISVASSNVLLRQAPAIEVEFAWRVREAGASRKSDAASARRATGRRTSIKGGPSPMQHMPPGVIGGGGGSSSSVATAAPTSAPPPTGAPPPTTPAIPGGGRTFSSLNAVSAATVGPSALGSSTSNLHATVARNLTGKIRVAGLGASFASVGLMSPNPAQGLADDHSRNGSFVAAQPPQQWGLSNTRELGSSFSGALPGLVPTAPTSSSSVVEKRAAFLVVPVAAVAGILPALLDTWARWRWMERDIMKAENAVSHLATTARPTAPLSPGSPELETAGQADVRDFVESLRNGGGIWMDRRLSGGGSEASPLLAPPSRGIPCSTLVPAWAGRRWSGARDLVAADPPTSEFVRRTTLPTGSTMSGELSLRSDAVFSAPSPRGETTNTTTTDAQQKQGNPRHGGPPQRGDRRATAALPLVLAAANATATDPLLDAVGVLRTPKTTRTTTTLTIDRFGDSAAVAKTLKDRTTLAGVDSLHVSYLPWEPTEGSWAALADRIAVDMDNMTTLSITTCANEPILAGLAADGLAAPLQVFEDGVRLLLNATAFRLETTAGSWSPAARRLSWGSSSFGVSPEGTPVGVSQFVPMAQLRRVALRGMSLDDECGVSEIAALAPRLLSLDLGGNRLGDATCQRLRDALVGCSEAEEHRDRRTRATAEQNARQATAVSAATLRSLWLDHNLIGDEGASALAVGLQHNTSVVFLDLTCNAVSGYVRSNVLAALPVPVDAVSWSQRTHRRAHADVQRRAAVLFHAIRHATGIASRVLDSRSGVNDAATQILSFMTVHRRALPLHIET